MLNFQKYLEEFEVDSGLAAVLASVTAAFKDIALAVKFGDLGKAGSQNSFGEQQLALDVRCNNIFLDHMKRNSLVGIFASEELDNEERISDGAYGVCTDPLDGSSLVDSNLAIGAIVGVYKRGTFVGARGDEQLASLACVFGPRTTFLVTVKKGVQEFKMDENGDFFMSNAELKVTEGKMFAPGNLRACKFDARYLELVNFWVAEQYTLRYSGGMVPDINQIMIKGKGIFSYPGYGEEPNGKLRLLFECAPLALLMEQAFGAASDGKNRILDKVIEDIHQRTPIFIGSVEEVERCKKYLG